MRCRLPITGVVTPSSSTKIRSRHASSKSTAGISVSRSMRKGSRPSTRSVRGFSNWSAVRSGRANPKLVSASRMRAPFSFVGRTQVQILRQTRVAMGNDRLSPDEKVVDLMVVEQCAQFDPVGEEHRVGSSLPRIRGARRPRAVSPRASSDAAPRGQPARLPRGWRTFEFGGSPVRSTRQGIDHETRTCPVADCRIICLSRGGRCLRGGSFRRTPVTDPMRAAAGYASNQPIPSPTGVLPKPALRGYGERGHRVGLEPAVQALG